jgi:hypothetical protein
MMIACSLLFDCSVGDTRSDTTRADSVLFVLLTFECGRTLDFHNFVIRKRATEANETRFADHLVEREREEEAAEEAEVEGFERK